MGASDLSAFLCRRFTETTEKSIKERYQVRINENDKILSSYAIGQQAKGCNVLFATATEKIDENLMQTLSPELKAIATLSVGYDHIDLDAAKKLGISVLNTPDVLSDACAEIAMMLILNACRRGYEADQLVRSGQWQGWAPTQLLGKGLVGQRVGIFGMGRIGRRIAARLSGFGVKIHYHNRSRLSADLENGVTYHDSLTSLMSHSDIFIVAAPGSLENKAIINADKLALLPDKAVLINISRGDLIEDEALLAALNSGKLFAAGLDVFANEPDINPAYRKCERVFLSPHIGSATEDTRIAMGNLLIDGLEDIWRGKKPANQLV